MEKKCWLIILKICKIQYLADIFVVYEFSQLNSGWYFVYNKTDIITFWSAGAVEV